MLTTFYSLDAHFFCLLLKYQPLLSHYLELPFHCDRSSTQVLAVGAPLFENFFDVFDVDSDLSYNHYDIFVTEQIFQMSHLLLSCPSGDLFDVKFRAYSVRIR